jgi:cellulose synthase/poly-beta-1,6-N-acetylglucosamine synthase-like glycosyltransferase
VIVAVLVVLTGLLLWHFAGYPLVMGWLALRTEPRLADGDAGGDAADGSAADGDAGAFVSVVVATYEEAGAIGDRIDNLAAQTYPTDRFEVVVVDSGSSDGTVEAAREAAAAHPDLSVRVVEQAEREGKASAVNAAIDVARGEVVLVTDANTEFVPEVLASVAPHFEDPDVGAVAGRLRLPETTNDITASNQFYRDLEHLKALGESRLDSAVQFEGELSAWRKGLARADPSSLAEDLELSVRIRRQGYRIAYEPRAVALEREPDNSSEQVTSNKRRAVGTIQTMLGHARWLAVPGDAYRAVAFPSRKAIPMFSPFLLLGILATYLVSRDPRLVAKHVLASGAAGAVTLAALLRVRERVAAADGSSATGPDADPDGESEDDGGIDLRSLPGLAFYVLLAEYFVLRAWIDYLTGDYSVLWEKSASDRTAAATRDAD